MQKVFKNTHTILFILCLFLFAFIPLYPKFPLINISGTFVAIRIEDFVIALTLGIWFVYLIYSKQISILFESKLNKAVALFFFIGAVSTFSAIFLTHSVVPHLGALHFLRRIEFMLLMPVVIWAINTKKKFFWTLGVLTLTVFLVNIYALGQQYLDWPVISTTNSEFSKGLILSLSPGARVNSTFAGHYDLAVFLTMTLSTLTALLFAAKKRFKLPLIVLGGLSLFILIITAARQSFVAAFIGIVFALILSKKKKYILLIFIGAILILLYPSQLRDRFISTLTVNVLNLGQRYQGRTQDQQIRSRLNIPTLAVKTSSTSASVSTFASPSGNLATDITPGEPVDSTQLGVYRSLEIRTNIEWPRAIRAFVKNPFLGTGYSSIDIATDNDFLRSLGEVGLLGTFSIILIFVELSKKYISLIKNSNKIIRYFSAGAFSMMVAFIINGMFIDVFEASKVASIFWMMMGLGISLFNFKDA
jgi:hypothetical protein